MIIFTCLVSATNDNISEAIAWQGGIQDDKQWLTVQMTGWHGGDLFRLLVFGCMTYAPLRVKHLPVTSVVENQQKLVCCGSFTSWHRDR